MAVHAGGALAAQVLGVGVRYLSAVLTTQLLGAAVFGTYSLGLTLALALALGSSCGLSPGILPFLSRARRTGGAAVRAVTSAGWRIGLAASAVTAAALALSSGPLAAAFDDARLAGALRVLAAFVVLTALVTVTGALLQGFMRVREQAWIEQVLVPGATLVGLLLVLAGNGGLDGVLFATLAGPLCGVGAGLLALSRAVPRPLSRPAAAAAPSPARAMLAASWPLVGSTLLAFLMIWKDVLLLGAFRPPEEVGVYAACARLAALVLIAHESIAPVFLSRLSDLFVAGDRDGIGRLYRTTARWALWAGLVLGGALVLWSRPILGVFGREFVAGAGVLTLLVSARVLTSANGMAGRRLAVTGHARLNLLNLVALMTVNVALALVWIPRHGGAGAALATLVSIAAIHAVQAIEVWALSRQHPWTRRSLVAIAAVGAAALAVHPFRDGPSWSGGWLLPLAAYCVSCAALFLVFGATRAERRALLAMLRRGR